MSRQKPGAGQEQARKGRNEGKKLSSHRGAQQNGRCSHSRFPPKTPPKLPFRFGDLPKKPRWRRMTSLRDAAISSSSHGLCSPDRHVTEQLPPPCPGCVGAMCVYMCVLTLCQGQSPDPLSPHTPVRENTLVDPPLTGSDLDRAQPSQSQAWLGDAIPTNAQQSFSTPWGLPPPGGRTPRGAGRGVNAETRHHREVGHGGCVTRATPGESKGRGKEGEEEETVLNNAPEAAAPLDGLGFELLC